jgi:hypothetical protein
MLILLKRPITEISEYLGHADINHDESLCAFPEAEKTGCNERLGTADSKLLGTDGHNVDTGGTRRYCN